MFLMLLPPPPAIVHTPSSDWDLAKAQLDALLHEKGGIGLIFSMEQKKPGTLTYSYMEQGGADSAWQLEILPMDPATQQPGKGDTVTRGGGFTAQWARPTPPRDLVLPAGAQQMLFRFRSSQFKGLGKVMDIPAVGAPAKVFYLHLPAR